MQLKFGFRVKFCGGPRLNCIVVKIRAPCKVLRDAKRRRTSVTLNTVKIRTPCKVLQDVEKRWTPVTQNGVKIRAPCKFLRDKETVKFVFHVKKAEPSKTNYS